MLCTMEDGAIRYVPSQGDYPSRGDYEYTGFAFTNEQLTEASVVPCVQALLRNLEKLPVDPARRAAQLAHVGNEAAKAADAAYENWGMELVRAKQPAFDGQIMSGYGPKRPHSSAEILKRLKIASHHIS